MMKSPNLVQNKCMDKQWFKQRLKEVGKTQRELATVLNLDPSVISRLIKGDVAISLRNVRPLAEFLEVSPAEALNHLGFPELLENKDAFSRERLIYAVGGVLDWTLESKEKLDSDELSEAIADFYEELGDIDPSQWTETINYGMGHRSRASRVLRKKQTARN